MSSKIKIIFFGTSDAVPSIERNHTSILLNYKDENILIDCGEGTQRQFRKAKINPCKLTRVLITHWHGDHVLGIPGLLQTLAFSGYNQTLFIYGPRGTKRFIEEMFKTFIFSEKINLEIKEVTKGIFFETNDFYLESEEMSHGIPCNAYNFVRKEQIRIDKKKLLKTKIPSGPLIKELKNGKNISYNGKKFRAKNLTYVEPEQKISFVFDTNYNNRIIPFAENSDLLICESSFDSSLGEKAHEYKHLTSKQAAEIAKKAKTKKLILTHISQRYNQNKKLIFDEAKKIFKNTELAKDFDRFEL